MNQVKQVVVVEIVFGVANVACSIRVLFDGVNLLCIAFYCELLLMSEQ